MKLCNRLVKIDREDERDSQISNLINLFENTLFSAADAVGTDDQEIKPDVRLNIYKDRRSKFTEVPLEVLCCYHGNMLYIHLSS